MSTGKSSFGDFEADENFGMETYTFSEKVKKRVGLLGVGNYQRPKLEKDHESIFMGVQAGQYFDGRLPTVIKKLDLDQLSALYSLYSNWYGYLTTQTMLVAAERSESMRKRDFLKRHLKNHYRAMDNPDTGKRYPETSLLDFAEADKRFITANAAYEELNALYEILDAMRKVADQDMKVISREVTIQQEKLRKELLLHGFGNRGQDNDFDNAMGDDGYGSTPDQTATPQRDRVQRVGTSGPAAGTNTRRVQARPRRG